MGQKRWQVASRLFLLAAVSVLIAVGCAKRPVALTAGSAPAPGGPPGSTSSAPGRTLADGPGVTRTTTPPGAAGSATPSPGEFRESTSLKDIHFDFDRYEIRPDDSRLLTDNATWMRANPAALILIEGHADERGTGEYNLALGDRRAKSAQNFLIAQGIAATRISVISYGKERPLCTEHAEGCWTKNRRSHFLVKLR